MCTTRAIVPTSARTSPPPVSLTALDHGDAELGLVDVVGEEVDDELPVARLEDVQRQQPARQQHGAEREHGHHGHPASMSPHISWGDSQRGANSSASGPIG